MATRTPSSSPSKSDMSAATDELYLNRYREEVARKRAVLASSPSSSPQKSSLTAAPRTSQKLPVVPTNTSVGGSRASSSRSPVKSGSTTPRAKAGAADFSYMDLYRPKPAPVPGSYLDLYRPGRTKGAASETSTATPTAPISCSSIVEVPAPSPGGTSQQSRLSVSNLSRLTPGSSSATSTRERRSSSSSVSTPTTKVYGLRYEIAPASLADRVLATHARTSAPPPALLKREAHSLPILARSVRDSNAQKDEKNTVFIKAVLKSPKPRARLSRSDFGSSELSSILPSESSSSTRTARPTYENSELETPSKSMIQATIRARAKSPFLRSAAENALLAEHDAAKVPSKRTAISFTPRPPMEPRSPQRHAPSSQSSPQGGAWKGKQVEKGDRSKPMGPREQQGERRETESRTAAPEHVPTMPAAVLWAAGMKEKTFKKKWEQKRQRERDEKEEQEREIRARLEKEIREQLQREMQESKEEELKKSPDKERNTRRQTDRPERLERLEKAQRAERERMKRESERRR